MGTKSYLLNLHSPFNLGEPLIKFKNLNVWQPSQFIKIVGKDDQVGSETSGEEAGFAALLFFLRWAGSPPPPPLSFPCIQKFRYHYPLPISFPFLSAPMHLDF
jgi:hypothetical protein